MQLRVKCKTGPSKSVLFISLTASLVASQVSRNPACQTLTHPMTCINLGVEIESKFSVYFEFESDVSSPASNNEMMDDSEYPVVPVVNNIDLANFKNEKDFKKEIPQSIKDVNDLA